MAQRETVCASLRQDTVQMEQKEATLKADEAASAAGAWGSAGGTRMRLIGGVVVIAAAWLMALGFAPPLF